MILRAMQDERRCGWRAYLPVPVRLRDFAMGMATAAILALVVYGILPDLWSDPDIQKVIHEASLAYGTHTTQHMPLEVVSADATAVTQWLNTHMGNHIKLPRITDTAAQLLGGRVCRILDRKSAALCISAVGWISCSSLSMGIACHCLPRRGLGTPPDVLSSCGNAMA